MRSLCVSAAALLILVVGGCDSAISVGTGACPASAYSDWESSPYVLPYPPGQGYRVLQGNCGSFSHNSGSHQEYAYDFRMPIGSVVVAARAGQVDTVVERFEDGQGGSANVVIVDHGDGSFARYLHLTQDGALVEVGDPVAAGDTLGLSGNTGFSTEPHLHFDVLARCYDRCRSVPVTFQNTTPNPRGLLLNVVYRALGAPPTLHLVAR